MEKTSRRTEADEYYEEIGEAMAALVVDAGWKFPKAWDLIRGIEPYRRWMLTEWIDRYREENPPSEFSRRRQKAKKRRDSLIWTLSPVDDPDGAATVDQ